RRRHVGVGVAVPVPGSLGNAEVINDAHLAEVGAHDAAMIKTRPDRLAGAPRLDWLASIPRQVSPARGVIVRAVTGGAAVFGDHVGYAGVLELRNAGTVAVVAGHV